MKPLVFDIRRPRYPNTLYLDKDGVLNKAIFRDDKLSSPRNSQEIVIKKDLKELLSFSRKRFNLVIISNQPDISRGLIDKKFIELNLNKILEILPIDQALFCPHLKSMGCKCRKPSTGLIEEYREKFPSNHVKELFIGDQETDEICASKLNIPFVKINDPLSLYNQIVDFPSI